MTYVRDYAKVIEELNGDRLDAFYLEDTSSRPCFGKMDYLRMAARLAFYVRNDDEFTTLFRNSGQDAVKWEPSDANWPAAKWYVRVAAYQTSGINRVDERWVYDAMLTQLMREVAARVVANTRTLLRLQATGKSMPADDSETGRLLAQAPPPGAKNARLWVDTPQSVVYTERRRADAPRGSGSRLTRTVTWWSPPVFYVHEPDRNGYTLVSGADYNTYAVLRQTSYEVTQLNAGEHGNYTSTSLAANEEAVVEILSALLRVEP